MELSDLAGVTPKSVQNAENGGPVSAWTIQQLCRALGCTVQSVVRPVPSEIYERVAAAGRLPPLPPRPFVGRQPELQRLNALLKAGEGPICIAGPWGVGKSSLAQQLLSKCAAQFPYGLVWVTATHGDFEAEPRTLLYELADSLGFLHELPNSETHDSGSISRAFFHHLARDPRLIVVDNVTTHRMADALAPSGCQNGVLITTPLRHIAKRYSPRIVELSGLCASESRELLDESLGDSRLSADSRDRLITHLGGLPRVIRSAGERLQRQLFTSPEALARELRCGLADAAVGELRDVLSPDLWSMLGCLAVCGEMSIPLSLAAMLGEMAEDTAALRLSQLADLYLVRCVWSGGDCIAILDSSVACLLRSVASKDDAGRERLRQWVATGSEQ